MYNQLQFNINQIRTLSHHGQEMYGITDERTMREFYSVSRWATFTFSIYSATVHQFSYFFTIKLIKDLWRKLELKLTPPLKSVAALPCEK